MKTIKKLYEKFDFFVFMCVVMMIVFPALLVHAEYKKQERINAESVVCKIECEESK